MYCTYVICRLYSRLFLVLLFSKKHSEILDMFWLCRSARIHSNGQRKKNECGKLLVKTFSEVEGYKWKKIYFIDIFIFVKIVLLAYRFKSVFVVICNIIVCGLPNRTPIKANYTANMSIILGATKLWIFMLITRIQESSYNYSNYVNYSVNHV